MSTSLCKKSGDKFLQNESDIAILLFKFFSHQYHAILFYFGFVLFFGEEGVFVEGIRPLLQLKSILKTMHRSPESHLYS